MRAAVILMPVLRRRIPLLLLGLLAAGALASCGGGDDFSGDADVPEGYKTFSTAGISFAHPGDWEVAERTDERLEVRVRDTGSGLPEGQVGRGLGTQIVRTLIQGELGGTIDWHTIMGSGTEVTIDIPLRYIERARD